MKLALSTHWNAHRHTRGEAMIDEIVALGFDRVELGYDTRVDLVPGIQQRVAAGVIRVDSLHNFCPVPVGAPRGHPEIFTLADSDPRVRQSAVHHIGNTIRFAGEIGARCVVCHAGNVEMEHYSRNLWDLAAAGQSYSPAFEKIKFKLQLERDKRAPKQVKFLEEGLQQLLPLLAATNVALCIENLPTWESIPTEMELESLLRRLNSPHVRYWHDVGHGQIRQNLGLINQDRWLDRLSPWLAGMHVHDVIPPASDHIMPPHGQVDFSRLKKIAHMDIIRVIEPTTQTPAAEIAAARQFLQETWAEGAPAQPETRST